MEISMRKSAALLLVLVFLTAPCLMAAKPAFSSVDTAEDTWAAKAPMHQARAGLGVAVVNGKIYAIGGMVLKYQDRFRTESVDVATNEEYDPSTDTWAFKAPMPTPNSVFVTAVYQDLIYCIGGSMNIVYNPANDTWKTKTPMPIARTCWGANVVNGKIYVLGGLSNDTFNEVYDPATDTWTTKESIPTQSGGCSGVFNDKIYVIGSKFEQGYFDELDHYVPGNYTSFTQIYDPATDAWSTGASPPILFNTASVCVTTGVMASRRMYVFSNPNTAPNASLHINQVYDPETDSWASGAAVPTSRERFATAAVDDLIYIIGGFAITYPDMSYWSTGGVLNYFSTVEQYTPFGYGTPDPSSSSPATTPPNNVQETFQATLVATASVATIAVIGIGLLVYFRKRRH
jgi:N-acetylneuraminic acid mutarotase